MINKLLGLTLSAVLVGSTLISGVASANNGNTDAVIDEKWGSPTFVYGSALSQEQVNQTKEILGITGETISLDISGTDMVRLLGGGNASANMYSSALISGNDNDGVMVQIVTPENITKVTTSQYANALITAGATNVEVKVASPVKVTGESALTGVYLAYEDKGIELDTEAMNVAQEELSVVTGIVEEASTNEQFNEESLNLALIEIKQQLAEIKENQGTEAITDAVVEQVVTDALENNELGSLMTAEQISQLVGLAKQYLSLDNFFTPEMQEQLSALASDVGEKAKELAGQIGSKITETLQDEGFWEGIKNFFTGIIDFFAGLFVSEEEPATN